MRSLWNRTKHVIKRPLYAAYERRLTGKARAWRKPEHIGIIMDGNRRFAREFGYDDVVRGHEAGAEKLHDVLGWCHDFGVRYVTLWAFSLDNFKRSESEVKRLLQLFEEKFREIVGDPRVHQNQVRIHNIGRMAMLPPTLQQAIKSAEDATREYTKLQLNVAVAYGGREEVTDALKRYLADEAEKGRPLAEVASEFQASHIDPYLYTNGVPDPDLIIRTSGELRMSGFLLWQSVYSEYYFCDTFWPAFRKIDFLRALRAFDLRQRRYGK